MAVMHEPVNERSGLHVIAKDIASVFEALVRSEHGRSALVAPGHELEEEHRAGAADREVAGLVDHQHGRMREDPQARVEPACGLCLFE